MPATNFPKKLITFGRHTSCGISNNFFMKNQWELSRKLILLSPLCRRVTQRWPGYSNIRYNNRDIHLAECANSLNSPKIERLYCLDMDRRWLKMTLWLLDVKVASSNPTVGD